MQSLASLPSLPAEPRVSIVIPALNEERYIEALLDSIESQTYPHHLIEVIVADGGSTDTTRTIVELRGRTTGLGALRLIENALGSTAGGLNAGAKAATGDVIIIAGAHSELDPDFVRANVSALQESGAAATGGPIETLGVGRVASAIAAAMSHPFGVGDAKFRYASKPGDVDTIAFAAYRREVFDALGGFDITKDKAEDDDFNFRLRKAGGRLYLTPAVRSRYFARASYSGLWRQYSGYGSAKGRAFMDDPAALGPRHFVPMAVVLGGAGLLILAPVLKKAARTLKLLMLAYGLAAALSGKKASERNGAPWWLTAIAFPIMHGSYGSGMALAIFRDWRARRV